MAKSDQINFDVIVVGLGAMGSGIAFQIARSGRRILGLDRYRPPHAHGSSHGHTRIIRHAYAEDERYIPYVRRAHDCWLKLEQDSGETLFIETGIVLMGDPQSDFIKGSCAGADRHGIEYERLDRETISRRWPALRTDPGMCGVWEPAAGVLRVEPCIETLLAAAVNHGAVLNFNEVVETWSAAADGVEVRAAGGTYRADSLVIAAGPWCRSLLPDLDLPLSVERQVQLWFEPAANPQLFTLERCPIYAWQHSEGGVFYGFPDLGHGVKVAHHHGGAATDPDELTREINGDDISSVRYLLKRLLPDANGTLKDHDVCMYTNTPDLNFLIDRHPEFPHVLIVGGCSGHGFKFAPVVGEIVRDLLADESNDSVLEIFSLSRLLQ